MAYPSIKRKAPSRRAGGKKGPARKQGGRPQLVKPVHGTEKAVTIEPGSADFDRAKTAAEASFSRVNQTEKDFELKTNESLYKMLGDFLAFHQVSEKLPERRKAFLKSAGLQKEDLEQTPYHQTVKALVPPEQRAARRQRISQYGQCLRVLEWEKVAPDQVPAWMAESGLTKALARHKDLPMSEEDQKLKDKAEKKKRRERNEKVRRLRKAAEKAPIGTGKLDEKVEDGAVLALVCVGRADGTFGVTTVISDEQKVLGLAVVDFDEDDDN